MTLRTLGGQTLVECEICTEAVPHGHTLLRPDVGRICWFCYTDENVDPDDGWDEEDGPDWDDDWDEWDDE